METTISRTHQLFFLMIMQFQVGSVGDDILFVCWVNSYILYIIIRLLVNLELIYFPGIAVVVGAGCCPAFVLNQS